jgi:hypothetical protein
LGKPARASELPFRFDLLLSINTMWRAYIAAMAANKDKVADKAEKELEEKIKAGKTSAEIERDLNPQNVAYKIKDNSEEEQK